MGFNMVVNLLALIVRPIENWVFGLKDLIDEGECMAQIIMMNILFHIFYIVITRDFVCSTVPFL